MVISIFQPMRNILRDNLPDHEMTDAEVEQAIAKIEFPA